MTPADAARLWLDGDREGCLWYVRFNVFSNDWPGGHVEQVRDESATRTAAVALELTPGPLAEPGRGRDDFLNYMAGRAE